MIISPLKVWVQNILPVVYDDSLSYLEIVAKINAKTNEIISQTNENTHAIETLANTIAELGDIEELRALLDEIEVIIEDLYTTDVPLMDGTASAGSANHAARSDHVHPSDTSKLNVADLFANVTPAMDGTASAGSNTHAARADHVHPSDNKKVNNESVAIIVDGNKTLNTGGAAIGQYVIVKSSTISNISDGMYKAAKVIPYNTALDNTYFATIQGGALNDLQTVSQYSLSIVQDVPGITLVRNHVTKYGKVVTVSLIFRFTADFPTGATTIIRLPSDILPSVACEGTALITETFKPILFNISTAGNFELTVSEAFTAQFTGRLTVSYITN